MPRLFRYAAVAKFAAMGRWRWNSVGAVAAAWGAIFLATVAFFARGSLPVVLLGLIADGGGALVWTASAGLGGAVLLRLARVRCHPALFAASACGLGLGVYSLVLLGLALAGWLTFWTTLALPAVSVALYIVETLRRRPAWLATGRIDLNLRRPAGFAWVWLLTAIPAGMAATAGGILPGVLWKPADPHPYDVVEYHLELPREWFEAGRMARPTHNIYGNFPANAEVQSLAAMHLRGGPWAGMYQAQYTSLIYAALLVLAVYGATQSPAAAALAAAVPWTVMLAGVAYNESAFLLYTALAAAWAVRALRRDPARRMAVAGAMAGVACGVKYTAVPMVAVGIGVGFAAAVLVTRKAWRANGVALAFYGLTALATFSPWLVRNDLWTGNPVYPLAMNLLGGGGLDAQQIDRWNTAHAPPPAEASAPARLAAFGRAVLVDPQYGWVLWPLALLAAAAGLTLRRSRPEAVLLITLLGTMAVVWVGFTHLQGRFFVPAIPVAALLVGTARGRFGRLISTVGAAAMLLACVLFVGPQLSTFAALGRAGFFGVTDLSFIQPPGLSRAAAGNTRPVVLAGSSQAFLYQIPMSRLHYRTVFDLPSDAPDALAAWVDPMLKDPILVIDPAEIARLHATYKYVPPLDESTPGPRDRPFVIDGR